MCAKRRDGLGEYKPYAKNRAIKLAISTETFDGSIASLKVTPEPITAGSKALYKTVNSAQ
ncbi:hypothetical protein FH505_01345 [Bacillus velezensis]|nr:MULTISPECIES: hypothetical protein [Bacillus]AVX15605.1 hypothetical protein C5I45_01325 [Bacillus sp. ZY-1-1]ASF56926.1 hypothetical protein CEG11_18230 [Bacillus velezensis]MEC1939539.1 hypothetical protein [Bacillus velezensis]NMV96435.1 hypothetical protein [Bacillus velezensis]QOX75373.1 hypothetical protein HWH77_09305 [Bacillus velezensis]